MKAKVFIISSVAGGGKSTLINLFLKKHPEFHFSISYTSRNKRPGDIHGVTYHFVDKAQFASLIRQEYFFEWALVHGNYYGTPRKEVVDSVNKGENVILDIDVQGAKAVKHDIKDSISIFILPPDEATWIERLKNRGTESEENLAKRIQNGKTELTQAPSFDYQIVNDNLERAYAEFESILLTSKLKN